MKKLFTTKDTKDTKNFHDTVVFTPDQLEKPSLICFVFFVPSWCKIFGFLIGARDAPCGKLRCFLTFE